MKHLRSAALYRTALGAMLAAALGPAAAGSAPAEPAPFAWNNATVYLALTDRFHNADRSNDFAYGRKPAGAPLRSFAGGDLAGVTAKIEDGYFDRLGVTVLWISPPVEQIHGSTDEGTGESYAYHGYWARDFTSVDANFGTAAELHALVDAAHARGIRVLLDVVMNQTGPVTRQDPVWPAAWVRTAPVCSFRDVPGTVDCALVANLPDLLTGARSKVALPPALAAKWRAEGRYQREVAELDAFFTRTGYPRAPVFHLIKWHADWVRKYGFDGIRADTAKHVEPATWAYLKREASAAFEDWKRAHPRQKVGDEPFFMTGEVWGYSIGQGQHFAMADQTAVNFFQHGFDSLINFSLPADARQDYESLFSRYAQLLYGPLAGFSVLNYMSSHDDPQPFDARRERPDETANKLLLAPGAAQIYYGDETGRLLTAQGAVGDAVLRSPMNWDELEREPETRRIFDHWSRLGRFRRAHPAVGAGVHRMLQRAPYVFARTYQRGGVEDKVVVALDLSTARITPIPVHGVFADGQAVRDQYSGQRAIVARGAVSLALPTPVVLLGADLEDAPAASSARR
jgi:alpha-amylase